ncbi:MAG: peptidylprolyl isomerase [Bacteroidales bacterium]|nr:peptidylprolyl isomerase [Bacteroidales bacterium]
MRKLIFSFIVLALFVSSCGEKQVVTQAQLDQLAIEEYLTDNNLDAQSTTSGLYYIIIAAGSTERPASDASITVAYVGKLLNGTVFDQSTTFTGDLNDMISGWKEGIPFIGAGGKIKLLIPSALGYGGQSTGKIPANSVLLFDVTLHSFINP